MAIIGERRLKCGGFTCRQTSLKPQRLRAGLEGQTLACLSGRMPATQQRESSSFCQSWVLVPEFAQRPCQRTLRCCSVCFSRLIFVQGKKPCYQLAALREMQSITNCRAVEAGCFLYASHSPPSPAGVWAMTEEYALSI